MAKLEETREAVMSIKTFRSIQRKIEFMARQKDRSVSNLLERILKKEILAYEKKIGKTIPTRP